MALVNKKDDFFKGFWVFLICSIVGFFVETVWCICKHGCFQSRSSMVFGPFTAVYGICALALFYAAKYFSGKNRALRIFIYGAIAGTAVEYLSSLAQETIVGSVSWDYSARILNIGGRVCLLYSIFWGLMSVLCDKVVLPALNKFITGIPARLYKPLTIGLAVFMLINIIVSTIAVARWGMRLDGVPAGSRAALIIDQIFPNEFMASVYPNMRWQVT
jgi:uncharacterized membrane protein